MSKRTSMPKLLSFIRVFDQIWMTTQPTCFRLILYFPVARQRQLAGCGNSQLAERQYIRFKTGDVGGTSDSACYFSATGMGALKFVIVR
ncbi:hypothetical protein MKY66_17805 [Paenibacillus sp. FSL R5-0766]|uniref:hypothetical protein n=1 Tax=Paenibacillus sp. FSL R5-0766 TaxID=2921658 RepID=UPI0030DCA664